MNIIDVVIIVFVLIFCVKGYIKGFINEIFTLIIIVLGLTGSFLFYKPLSSSVFTFIENRSLSFIVSFLSIFAFITVVLIIIRNAITNMVDSFQLTNFDYLLGLLVGLTKGTVLIGAILIFLKNHPVMNLDIVINGSLIFPFLESIFFTGLSKFPENLELFIYRVLDAQ
ncbi:MAG TPA: CvpA family protein [Spirochaetes bacterium]|nr:CvpA family protein [Spirochaetota bacterium]